MGGGSAADELVVHDVCNCVGSHLVAAAQQIKHQDQPRPGSDQSLNMVISGC
jgi:hypothetical protein